MPERREHDLAELFDIVAPAVGFALVGRFLRQMLQMPRKSRGERCGVLLANDGRTAGERGRFLQRLDAGRWRAKGWPVSDGLLSGLELAFDARPFLVNPRDAVNAEIDEETLHHAVRDKAPKFKFTQRD